MPDQPIDDAIRAARAEVAQREVIPADTAGPGEHTGDVIDRYRLLQEIGSGGMGTVWMAQQLEPVARRVALKIVKLGMDTREVVGRFEVERQALALMDHPSIAKVFDGGSTRTGRPYFVMELVHGVPITQFCDDARLDLRARLELFARVCEAIQHAHQKGIIHRDIKPSNVLVTLHDGAPLPKVIDFGIAKATGVELTRKTMFTRFAQWIGTPEYMAPEQAGLSAMDIDTRADVYSLGVLLYELLTGTKPFDAGRALELSYEELLRTIREDDPAKPSTRVSTLGPQATTVAARRHVALEKLQSRLRGDLDWITMRALEKDRSRRYDTPNDLAADVRRHLRGEAVAAAPPGVRYRLRKFLLRRRKAVAVAASGVFLLLAGTTGTTIGWLQARAAEAEATTQARRARTELKKAELARDVLLRDVILAADPLRNKGPEVRVRDVLEEAGRRLDRGELLADEPDLEEWLRQAVATAFRGLGLFDAAIPHLRRSVALRRQLHGADGDVYADALTDIAALTYEAGRLDEAAARHAEALALLRALARPELESGAIGERAGRLALGLHNYAALLIDQNRIEEAEATVRESMSIWERQGGPDHLAVSSSKQLLCQILAKLGRMPAAVQAAREALAIRQRCKQPGDPLISASLLGLATVLQDSGDTAAAAPLLDDAITQMQRSWPDGHPRLAAALTRKAHLLRTSDLDGAIGLARQALGMRRQAYSVPHKSVVGSLRLCAELLREAGQLPAAELMAVEAVAAARTLPLAAEAETGASRTELASVWHALGRRPQARAEFEAAIGMLRSLAPAGGSEYLARALHRSGIARKDVEGPAAALAELVEAEAMATRLRLPVSTVEPLRAAARACQLASRPVEPPPTVDGK